MAMRLASLLFVLLPVSSLGQFGGGGYKPPVPQCKPFSCGADEKPMRKKGHKTWSYGCPDSGGANFLNAGDFNLNAKDPLAGMKKNSRNFDKCCLEHDACLQTCGMSSQSCHDVYEKCSAKVCKGDQNCGFQAQMAQMMNQPYDRYDKDETQNLGESDPLCRNYDKMQQDSCECVSEDSWEETFEKRLKTFYKLYNKEKISGDGDIKDMDQVKTKWKGKEPEMFLELTKKYKDKAIERRTKPKPPPYTPPAPDDIKDRGEPSTATHEDRPEPSTEQTAFQSNLRALEQAKGTAAADENFDRAGELVDEIRALKKAEVERLRSEKALAIDNEDYLKAKSIKKEIEALDPKQEL